MFMKQRRKTPLVLHSKLAIVDADTLFVSSTSVEPRSFQQNEEIGMVIKSSALAKGVLDQLSNEVGDYVFNVTAGPNGDPEWLYEGAGIFENFVTEPGVGLFVKCWRQLRGGYHLKVSCMQLSNE